MNDTAPKGTQYLDLAFAIANETCHYLQNGELTTEKLQKLIGDKNLIREIARKNAHEMLALVPDKVVQAKEILEKFFKEVFNEKVNLSKVSFPEREGMLVYCFNPRTKNEDEIMDAIAKKWGIDVYKYLSPVAKKIDRQNVQSRPKGPYAFCHTGEEEPDVKHRGKSYHDAIKEGFPFANAEEYLLMQAFHKYTTGHFMDIKGWTRTSSLWSDGNLVCGNYNSDESKLSLYSGYRDLRGSGDGPRELSL